MTGAESNRRKEPDWGWMSKAVGISQVALERALKACKRAGYEKARVHINLGARTIDIMLGEDGPSTAGTPFERWKAEKDRQGQR